MYLKKIEVQGFKSFANKIVFEFHNGITGIVGPNGSGKSNVSDAVRWVLGEQSAKQLRGGNMQDVIFAGTELRKPQGYAFVAITMDNSDHALPIDFDEVVVSRRLYRSGESEYMMNGSACRLKDINELFYDTGIGKDGYSIIGQGQVDKILSGKPDDRRELFDEAAGITKFKRRKVLAQKKLESERQNLLRITDILTELEKQVGPLQRQSEEAKEYLRLKDELKRYDVNAFLLESGALRQQLTELEGREGILTGDLADANAESDKLKVDYEDLENLINELDEILNTTREAISAANIDIGDLTGRINVLNEQINTEKMNEEHITSRIKAIDEDISARTTTLEDYEKQKAEADKIVEEAEEKQKETEKILMDADEQIMLYDQKIEDDKTAMIAAINEKAEISSKSERYETLLEQIQLRSSEIAQKILKIKSDESTLDVQYDSEKKKLDDIVMQIGSLDEEQNSLATQAENCEKEVIRLAKVLQDTQAEYQTGSTKLESLRNLAERYDGYGNSIKRVMETRDRIHGIHGVIADIIQVDKDYETAIETALGGKIQNVVTDSEETAKQLIEHLKKNQFGRATFLPLTSIGRRNRWEAGAVMQETGVVGLASDLVKTDDQYSGLMTYLLGKILVVDNIDHAIAIEKKYNYDYRIVTKEGESLNPGGSMSGGAFKNNSNLLGRKREIDELEEMVKKALDKAESTQNDLDQAREELKNKNTEIEEVKVKKQDLYISKNTVEVSLSQIDEKRSEIEGSSSDMELEHTQLEEQVRDIDASKLKLAEDIKALEDKNTSINEDITETSAKLEAIKHDREGYAQAVSQVQLDTANAKQKLSFIEENLNRIHDEISKFNEEKAELSAGTDGSKSIIEEKQTEINQTEAKISEITEQIKKHEETLRETLEKKDSKSGEQKAFFEKRDAISERISALDKDLFRLQNSKEKCQDKIDTQVTYMWNEYELTYQTAEPLKDEELSNLSEIKKTIDGLKNDIKSLGNVNVNAIEDYKDVSGRYELIKTQHDDIVEAEAQLQKIIEELDTGMRNQFEEKFREIGLEFDKVFKELFGGGVGKLELEEDVDLLEAGIHIIAQPPGKKLQNMMQLSGGEKALTAISLLFAIQNLKPSPFALLDEIEAALDDSNVDRFAKYLHKLTKNTQFIVITHRRGTMVAADRLYGITMQEKGVSTLVSVNLIEDKLDD